MPPKRIPPGAVPTSHADLERINAMFDTMAERIAYLHARWQDEKEYEDFAEYRRVVEKRLPEGFTLTDMTKRPFAFTFTIGTPALYWMGVRGDHVCWRRIH